MHIVMLSDWETQYGGAAVAASRLAEGLCAAGHRVTRVVSNSDHQPHVWDVIELRPSPLGWAMRRMAPDIAWEEYGNWESRRGLRKLLDRLRPDVINVHNLHGAVVPFGWHFELVRVCVDRAPTVWTLHDMWSFTGRCAYSYDCQKYLTGCDATCPTPAEYPALDPQKIAVAWKRRQRIFSSASQLVAVSPSVWLSHVAKQGLWSGHKVEIIPNGLPLDIYRPVDRSLARQALDIEAAGPVMLVTAFDLSDRRKGAALILDALKQVTFRPFNLVTLGGNPPTLNIDGIRVHHLGYIDHERSKALAYSAADLYVHPALADNLPNTVMEAIACGTPVVGSNIGGVPDMIRPGRTGWLAKETSPEALAAVLQSALEEVSRGLDLRASCRAVAEAEYSLELQVERYLALFGSL